MDSLDRATNEVSPLKTHVGPKDRSQGEKRNVGEGDMAIDKPLDKDGSESKIEPNMAQEQEEASKMREKEPALVQERGLEKASAPQDQLKEKGGEQKALMPTQKEKGRAVTIATQEQGRDAEKGGEREMDVVERENNVRKVEPAPLQGKGKDEAPKGLKDGFMKNFVLGFEYFIKFNKLKKYESSKSS
ncbi:hypothetical protein AMTRI_Chr07g75860 [Amborella trichopoda]